MIAREQKAASKRERNKRYRESENGRAHTREAYKRYCKTDKGKSVRKRNK